MSRPTGLRADARVALVMVRLVEGAVVVLLVGAAHELWSAWQNAGVDGFLGRGPVLLDRVWSVVHNQSRGPVAALVAAALLAGGLWLAQSPGERKPGQQRFAAPGPAGSVRIEVAVLAVVGLVLVLAEVVVVVVAAAVPYGPELGPSPLVPGEDQLTVLLPVAAWPFAGVLLYAALGCLWWLLRPEATEAAQATAPVAAPAGADPVDVKPADAPARAEAQAQAKSPSPDGSTTNGYEEYFRRS